MTAENDGGQEPDKRLALKDRLVAVIEEFQKIYYEGTRQDFLELFALLGYDEELLSLLVINVVDFFDPVSRRFRIPQFWRNLRFMFEMREWLEFQRAIDNFKPGAKGSEGGLKRFAEKFRKMKALKVEELKEYKRLREKEKDGVKLAAWEKKNLEDYKRTIPSDIKNKMRTTPRVEGLAMDWLTMELRLPCTKSTLKQIISRRPKEKDTKNRTQE